MELNINLNAEEMKKVIEDGTLAALVGCDTETVSAAWEPAVQTTVAPSPVAPADVPKQEEPAPQTVVPTAAPAFTPEQLSRAAAQLADGGEKQKQLLEVFAKLGINALTELDPSRFEEFAAMIRELGAKI